MEKLRKESRLPYLVGGVPGALAILLFVTAIVASVSLVAAHVTAADIVSRGRTWEGILTIAGCVTLVPPILAGIGALILWRGRSGGARLLSVVCTFQRVLLVLELLLVAVFGTIGLFQSISACSEASQYLNTTAYHAGFVLGQLASLGGSIAILSMMIAWYGWMKTVVDHIESEIVLGLEKITSAPAGPVGFSITFGVISAVAFALAFFLPDSVLGALDYSARSVVRDLMTPATLVLFLQSAQFFLMAGFFRGFGRSHRNLDRENPVLRSPRYAPASTLAVLGALLLSWRTIVSLRSVISWLTVKDYYSSPAFSIILTAVWIVADVLLAVALLTRARWALTIAGASLGAGLTLLQLLLSSFGAVRLISGIVELSFWILLVVGAILALARKKPVPTPIRIILLVLAVLTAAGYPVVYLFSYSQWSVVCSLFVNALVTGITCAALGFARVPAEASDAPGKVDGTVVIDMADETSGAYGEYRY